MKPDWKNIRRQFALDPSVIHLGAFWLSSYPRVVRDTIDSYRSELDKNPVFYLMDNEERLDRSVRESIAAHINGNPDHVALTGSTTEGLALCLAGWYLPSNAEILTTSHEHYSAYSAVELLAQRTGATVKRVNMYQLDAISRDGIVASIVNAISSRTRLVVITWVHSCTGVRVPIEEICGAIRQINTTRKDDERVSVCIDATHGFGALKIDVTRVGCDLFVSSCHKWLNGPRGTGFMHISAQAAESIRPIIPSFAPHIIGRFTSRSQTGDEQLWERFTPGGFHSYEHRWAVSSAVDFANAIGREQIESRILELASELKSKLTSIPRVELITPQDNETSAGIICFAVNGLSPESTVAELRKRNIVASVSPYRIRYARFTPSYFNEGNDIVRADEALMDIVRKL